MVLAGLILAIIGLAISAIIAILHLKKLDQGFQKIENEEITHHRRVTRLAIRTQQILEQVAKKLL